MDFLYEQRPAITIDNAGGLFEMAEFLMIDELKSLCIEEMRSFPVNMETCLKLFLLMCTYEFNFPRIYYFILGHLPELFAMDEMLLLDKDSVRYIITEPMFSYVSREDCFRFLLKWTKHCSLRQLDFPELCSCLKHVSKDVLNTEDLTLLNENNRLLCNRFPNASNISQEVLVLFPAQFVSRKWKLLVYNFELSSWFQLPINDDSLFLCDLEQVQLKTQNTFIRLQNDTKMIYYNIEQNTRTGKRVEVAFCDERPELKHLNYINNKLHCVRNFTFFVHVIVQQLPKYSIEDGFYHPQYGYKVPGSVSPHGEMRLRKQMQGCSIYVAEDGDDNKIILKPIISLRGTAKAFCVLSDFVCLLMDGRKDLVIYALNEVFISFLNLTDYATDEAINIFRCHVGGVYVVTKASILQIDIKIISDNKIRVNIVDTWMFKPSGTTESPEDFEITSYDKYPPRFEIVEDKIFTISRGETKLYYQMLPRKIGFLDKEERIEIELPDGQKANDNRVLQMRLPKDSLICHIDCPHCRNTDQDQVPSYNKDDYPDDYSYYDDSDDNNGIRSGNDYYDSDDDYYYYSHYM